MAIPTKAELTPLDVAHGGAPFVRVPSGIQDTNTLDVAAGGAPFVAGAGTLSNDSDLTLPSLTATGATVAPPADGTSVAWPMLTGTGTGTAAAVGNSALSLPILTGSGSAIGVTLPMLTGEGAGTAGAVARSTLELPAMSGSATGDAGVTGDSVVTLASLTGSGGTPPESDVSLPLFTGTASALTGTVATSNAILPVMTGAATGATPIIATSSLPLPALDATGSASSGVIGASNATLAALLLAAEGFSGTLGTSALTLPILTTDGAGHVQITGTSVITLPMIVAGGQSGTIVGATYSAYALNTESRALTTYSGMSIKGLAKFNGVYLAAGPGGLFVLDGDTDAGVLINASARLAATDFGDPHIKRVEAMYVQYRTTGDLALKVILNEHEEYEYTLPAAGHATLAPQRVKIGRGAKGLYWQFDIANRDGADFEFDSLSVEPLVTSRKVG